MAKGWLNTGVRLLLNLSTEVSPSFSSLCTISYK